MTCCTEGDLCPNRPAPNTHNVIEYLGMVTSLHAYVRIEIARGLDDGLGKAGMSKVRVPSLSRSLITIFRRRCDQTKNKALPLGRGGYSQLG
jgi:hypothetical protein